MATVNYVKFMRGSQTLYNSLKTKDKDTLYFVCESESSDKGKLYLGNKLISGGSDSSSSGTISLGDITDVVINAGITDGDVLVYNDTTKKWESASLADYLKGKLIMIGATATQDGASGLVPAPQIGEQGKYLRGDGTWANVEAVLSTEDQESISRLKAQVATLIDTDADKSVRAIASEELTKELIPDNAKESLDTLTEIANWIQTHPDDAAAMNKSLTELRSTVATVVTTVNGSESNPSDGLVPRVRALESTVGSNFKAVEGKYLDLGSAAAYFNTSITEINDRLRWHELGEDE